MRPRPAFTLAGVVGCYSASVLKLYAATYINGKLFAMLCFLMNRAIPLQSLTGQQSPIDDEATHTNLSSTVKASRKNRSVLKQ